MNIGHSYSKHGWWALLSVLRFMSYHSKRQSAHCIVCSCLAIGKDKVSLVGEAAGG